MHATSISHDIAAPFGAHGVDIGAVLGARTGFDAVQLLDSRAIGGNTLAAMVEGDLGTSEAAALDLSAATGSSAQTVALLLGASGVDTLGADVAMTGRGQGDVAIEAMGSDSLWARDDVPSVATSRDISVSLVLHRIAGFSMTTPSRVALRMGYAN